MRRISKIFGGFLRIVENPLSIFNFFNWERPPVKFNPSQCVIHVNKTYRFLNTVKSWGRKFWVSFEGHVTFIFQYLSDRILQNVVYPSHAFV